jgi:hypothetical protein
MKFLYLFLRNLLQSLMCSSSDVLEGKGTVRVAITTGELLKFHQPRQTHI